MAVSNHVLPPAFNSQLTLRNNDGGLYDRLQDLLHSRPRVDYVGEVGRVAHERRAPVPVNDCMRAAAPASTIMPSGDRRIPKIGAHNSEDDMQGTYPGS